MIRRSKYKTVIQIKYLTMFCPVKFKKKTMKTVEMNYDEIITKKKMPQNRCLLVPINTKQVIVSLIIYKSVRYSAFVINKSIS